MSHIVMSDDGLPFDGRSLRAGPLGGAETAFVSLAEALARRGHRVDAYTRGAGALELEGVRWRSLGDGLPDACDLYIANRGDRLIELVPGALRRAFWLHNPARYLLKWRYLSKLWRSRPVLVFAGEHHRRGYPAIAPDGGRLIVPLGVSEVFRTLPPPEETPPPRAIFTSNPLRGLDWLLRLWVTRIQPRLPEAELHVFSGPQTYGGGAKAARMEAVLQLARDLAGCGVHVHPPVSKAILAEEMRGCRVMLYGGDQGETFCLAVAEAQAAGLPCVVGDRGAVPERVRDGQTGFVARDDEAFVGAALRLLSDDALWWTHAHHAIAHQRGWGWDEAAAAFEDLVPA